MKQMSEQNREAGPCDVSSARRGMVLLFVVVLLTLLAVMGGAYLISSRIDNSQVSPTDRGGEANPMGLDAADRIDQIMLKAQDATKRKLFLDAFAYNGIVPANAGTFPSAQRILGDDSGDPGGINNRKPATDPVDPNGIIGDGVPDLIWRPTEANRQAVMPVPGAPPAANELGVYTPMAVFGGFAATRAMFDFNPVPPTENASTVHFPYYHVDGLGGTDTHLASRLPPFDAGLFQFVWPWVSAPIVGVPDFPVDNIFVNPLAAAADNAWISFDPRPTMVAGFIPSLQRYSLIPGSIGPVAYSPPPEVSNLTGSSAEFYNDRLRTWPAFLGDFDFAQDGPTAEDSLIMMAADADGDGVADSGLVPIVFDESQPVGSVSRYLDPQTGYVYVVGIRIVDNNDAINVNTALTRFGDLQVTPAGIDLAENGEDSNGTSNGNAPFDFDTAFSAPNRGIYLSNIGLLELFFQGADIDLPGTAGFEFDDTGGGLTRTAQFRSLLPTLLGNPASMIVNNTAPWVASGRTDVQFATLGELLGMSRDRLLENPGTADGVALINPFRALDEDGSLLFNGGGWLEPEVSPTRLENAAPDALRTAAGNSVPNAEMMFDIFPLGTGMGIAGEDEATMRALWAAHFKSADPDMTTLGQFRTAYAGLNLGTRFSGVDWPLSPRAALVAHNGTSQAFRPQMLNVTLNLATAELPEGMPPYLGTTPNVRPPVRASANTAGFAELWRAFWNVMVEPDFSPAVAPYVGPVPTYLPGQRQPGMPQDTTQRMFRNDAFEFRSGLGGAGPHEYHVLTLRAALAAINALDIRDVEDIRHSHPGVDATWGTPDDANPLATAADIILPEDRNGNGTLDPGEDVNGNALLDPALFVRVAGGEAQPFITEVYIVFTPLAGEEQVQYLGIELYNPYPFELRLQNWYLIATLRRGTGAIETTAGPSAPISLTGPDFTTPINITIPPNSYVVLENQLPPAPITHDAQATTDGRIYTYPASGGLFLPAGTGRLQTDPATGLVTSEISREIVLMRPLDPSVVVLPTTADELIERYLPVDQFDPTGANPTVVIAPPGTDPRTWRYVRPNGVTEDLNGNGVLDPTEDLNGNGVLDPGEDLNGNGTLDLGEDLNGNGVLDRVADPRGWKFVSHGRYDTPAAGEPGTRGLVPVPPPTTASLGAPDAELAGVVPSGLYGTVRSIPWGPVLSGPIAVDDGLNVQKPLYPYGGFARDGDALGIPFFGAYRVYRDTNGDGLLDPLVDDLLELISPPLDAFFVDSGSPVIAPATTHVGRFIPQGQAFVPGTATPDEGYNWARDLFEYITTLHAPGKDYAPHADTRYIDNSAANPDNSLLFNPGSIPVPDPAPTSTTLFDEVPAGMDQDGNSMANGIDAGGNVNLSDAFTEAFLPVEGQINLNTASFGILKTLPLAVGPAGTVDLAAAARISGANPGDPYDGLAGAAFLGRDPVLGSGTYDSLFRLNALPEDFGTTTGEFRDFGATAGVSRRAAGDLTGIKHQEPLLTPPTFADLAGGTADAWYYDNAATPVAGAESYEDHTIQLTRISNLTTLRSDSYTVYIVVQAWENFGNPPQTASTDPPPARLVRQERSAFIVDRSGILPINPATNVPWAPDDVNGDAWRDALKITPVPTR